MSTSTDFFHVLPINVKLSVLEARLRAAKAPFALIAKAGDNFVETDVVAAQADLANLVAERNRLVDEVLVEADNFLGFDFGKIAGTIGKVVGGVAGVAGKAISIAEKIGPIIQKVSQAKGVLENISGALAKSSNLVEDKEQTKQIEATAQQAEDLGAALARVQGSLKALEEHKEALTSGAESFTEGEPEGENFLPFLFKTVGTVVDIVKQFT